MWILLAVTVKAIACYYDHVSQRYTYVDRFTYTERRSAVPSLGNAEKEQRIMPTSTYKEKRETLLRIMQGRKFPGNKLPPEETLTEMLSCSRGMLREILQELEYKGYITKKHRVGNFIHPSAFHTKMRIELYTSFHDLILSGGYEPSVKVIKYIGNTMDIPAATQERLRMQNDEGADYTERVYFADGKPAILSKCFIPKGIMLRQGYNSEDGSTLFDFLKRFCNQEVEQMQLHFFIEQAAGELTEIFRVPQGKPLLLWEEAFYNYCNEIVAISYSYFNMDIMQLSMLKRYQKVERG